MGEHITFQVDGSDVTVADDGRSLLDVLREDLRIRSVKDGCSPQGQCGCCTVLVDDAPRVACVTPARRVAGRRVTTLDGLGEPAREWAAAFLACGASQCGFCTPGIVVRLEGLRRRGVEPGDHTTVERGLAAHLCRCTGWRTILDAYDRYGEPHADRDLRAASARASIEGRTPQAVGPEVVLGRAGFADDTAPEGALVAVPDGSGDWAVGETPAEARAAAGSVQGRRSSAGLHHPVRVPEGQWDVTLRTTWVEPAYLELDASWCEPGGEPASPLANGGAFGGKVASHAPAAARELADRHGRSVRVLLSREDTVRSGAKRPPLAVGARRDRVGAVRVARTPGIADAIRRVAPGLAVEEVDVVGPPTSTAPRAAGWAEVQAVLAAVEGVTSPVVGPDGGRAEAEVGDGGVRVSVACGDPLDEAVLRSYCVGAAHMALGLVTSEGIGVDEHGEVHDLTVRSFGVLRASDTPPIDVEIEASDDPPVNGSDAVFAAVAAAAWLHQGCPPTWPTGVAVRSGR